MQMSNWVLDEAQLRNDRGNPNSERQAGVEGNIASEYELWIMPGLVICQILHISRLCLAQLLDLLIMEPNEIQNTHYTYGARQFERELTNLKQSSHYKVETKNLFQEIAFEPRT